MEVIFQKKAIEDAATAARGISSENNANPLLSNVLIIAREDEDKIEIKASNGDTFVRCMIPAQIKEPGTTTVPAAKFQQIISEMPNAEINFKFDGVKVIISCLENTYKLAVLPPEDFPKWPEMSVQTSIEVPQADLKKAIEGVLFAAAQNDPRKVLLGGLFDVKDNTLITVSTDGKKLSYTELGVPEVVGQDAIKSVVPAKVLAEVQKFLKFEGNTRLDFSKNQINFAFSGFEYTAKLIDGNYPQYQNVIPKEFIKCIEFSSDEFSFALRRAAIITDEKTFGVVMRFSQNKVEMQTNIYDLGSFDGFTNVKYEGEQFTMAFNYKNLQDVFRLLGKCDVEMKIKGNEAPTVIKKKDEEKSFFIIMPIKLADLPSLMPQNNTEEQDEARMAGGSPADDEWEEQKETEEQQ